MLKKLCILLVVIPFLGLQACAPLPLIIDTDMGQDDVMALLSLLRRTDVSIKAITVTGTGLAHGEEGLSNLHRLLDFMDCREIPTAFGRARPLEGENFFPSIWREKSDTLLDHLPNLRTADPSHSAVELLHDVLASSREKVTLLALVVRDKNSWNNFQRQSCRKSIIGGGGSIEAIQPPPPDNRFAALSRGNYLKNFCHGPLGPLTNIAELFRLYPELIAKIEKLFIMGGAVDVPGNLKVIEGNHVAEWNIFADPTAAEEVFRTGLPLYLIALDGTDQTPLTLEYYEYVERNRNTPMAHLFYHMLTCIKERGTMHRFYFWDLQAAEVLLDPSLAHFEPRTIRVITEAGPQCGRTMACDTGYPIQLATKIDGQKSLHIYFDTINGQ